MGIEKNSKGRLVTLDFIRGVNFISMVLYHAMYDVVYIFDRAGEYSWYKSDVGFLWQQLIAWTFIILSGFSVNLGKHHLKHGIKVFCGGILITISTILFFSSQTIHYGILTFMGLAGVIMCYFRKLLKWVNPYLCAAISFLLFSFTRYIHRGFLGFFSKPLLDLPESLYSIKGFAFLGFPTASFRSADYFPLIPWIFLFIFGYFVGRIVLSNERITHFLRVQNDRVIKIMSPVCFVGRHTLNFYIVHQPLVYALLWCIFGLIK